MEKSLSMTIVVIICISDVLSTGSPWDWQSVNAKYSGSKEGNAAGQASSKVTINVSNITVHQGHTALLPCRVEQLNQNTVSWLRSRDTSVLSVGQHIFSSDKRMSVKASSSSSPFVSIWSLQIDSVSAKDEGWYDCQVNTEPKVSHQSYLHIEQKSSRPAASPPRRALHTELSDAPSNPQVIPEIQHFLKSMTKQHSRLKLQIRGSRKLQQLREGDPLVLECVTLSPSASLIKDQLTNNLHWIRESSSGGGEALTTDIRSRLRQVPQNGKAILRISSVIQSDEGSYTCLSQDPKVDSATVQIKLSGLTEKGPLALAQTEEINEDDLKSSFELEVDSRLTTVEARLLELELEVNHLLQLQEDTLLALHMPPSRGHSFSMTTILWLILCTTIYFL